MTKLFENYQTTRKEQFSRAAERFINEVWANCKNESGKNEIGKSDYLDRTKFYPFIENNKACTNIGFLKLVAKFIQAEYIKTEDDVMARSHMSFWNCINSIITQLTRDYINQKRLRKLQKIYIKK